jgi:hypothetical protein
MSTPFDNSRLAEIINAAGARMHAETGKPEMSLEVQAIALLGLSWNS